MELARQKANPFALIYPNCRKIANIRSGSGLQLADIFNAPVRVANSQQIDRLRASQPHQPLSMNGADQRFSASA